MLPFVLKAIWDLRPDAVLAQRRIQRAMKEASVSTLPLLSDKHHGEPSVFEPAALLREARRQKRLPFQDVPPLCILDPDGDIVHQLAETGRSVRFDAWACYHTRLDTFELGGRPAGIVGHAVGAPFAVLVAEQLFASGCRMLVSCTSAGQIIASGRPPYFAIIDRALRDEGTSYHYAPPAEYAEAERSLVAKANAAFTAAGYHVRTGASWTTDAPYRETMQAIAAAKARGILAVEMEAAALYAFAAARKVSVLCLAHITNTMGQSEGDFEKGEADGASDALELLHCLARTL